MNGVLILRDTLRAVYSRYGTFLKPVLKMLLAFVMLVVIQKNIGCYAILSKPAVILAASVVCAFFPWGFISFIAALFVIGNMFAVSTVMAAAAAAFCVAVFVLYYGYHPGTGIIISLVPLMFALKLPFVVPLILGLTVGVYAALPAAIGVAGYGMIHFFAGNVAGLNDPASAVSSSELIDMGKNLMHNKYMLVTLIAFVLCITAVSIISRSSINNCRVLSVSVGAVILAVLMIIGGAILGEGSLIAGVTELAVSYIISVAYVQVFYGADYRRIERICYEDDDYYYYVKAVPKLKPYNDER